MHRLRLGACRRLCSAWAIHDPGVSRSPLRHVAKRLDVLVMDSGEFELPDEVRLRDIGVPRGVACACLAETVVLAPENRYETSTVGRDIDWVKVKEIYRLGLKHRMKPSAISGVNGVFTH